MGYTFAYCCKAHCSAPKSYLYKSCVHNRSVYCSRSDFPLPYCDAREHGRNAFWQNVEIAGCGMEGTDVGAVRFRFREINFSFAYEVNDRCGFGGTLALINLHLAGTITLWLVILLWRWTSKQRTIFLSPFNNKWYNFVYIQMLGRYKILTFGFIFI